LHRSEALYHEALDIYRTVDDRASIAEVLRQLAEIAKNRGDLHRSEALYHEALDIYRTVGDRASIAEVSRQLAEIAKNRA
jgi:RNA polymerase-interacting CarD/CdnL/TRCF family regulator